MIMAAVALVALAVFAGLQTGVVGRSSGEFAVQAPREYGALTPIEISVATQPAEESTSVAKDLESPAVRVPETPGSFESAPILPNGRPTQQRSRPGAAYRISSRPATDFDRERLAKAGFTNAEIDMIVTNFLGLIDELRASSLTIPGGALSPHSASPEERERFHDTREEYLSEREYDAALYATNQRNRMIFDGPIRSGTLAAEIGLRQRDQLLAINGVRVFDLRDYGDGRGRIEKGADHHLVILRDGEILDVSIECCAPEWGGVSMRIRPPISEELAL